ncbi:MAG: hypothetical protein M4579_007392, partial [Chaenotheca gracillima]
MTEDEETYNDELSSPTCLREVILNDFPKYLRTQDQASPAMTTDAEKSYPLHLPAVRYPTPHTTQTPLHTVDIWLPHHPASTPAKDESLWVIYIHGGAWRDPAIDASSFQNTVNGLLHPGNAPGSQTGQSAAAANIAGLASISYRLSPYPSHSTDPSSPSDPARNVTHPAHLQDIRAALHYLQTRFRIGERYLLVGHSCGATLGWQFLTSPMRLAAGETFEKPIGIVGVAGIYDLHALVEAHPDVPVYADIVRGAFTTLNPARLSYSSPTALVGANKVGEEWENGTAVVVVQSRDDGLVEATQATRFTE